MESLPALRRDVLLGAAIVAPFILNDFAFMAAGTVDLLRFRSSPGGAGGRCSLSGRSYVFRLTGR